MGTARPTSLTSQQILTTPEHSLELSPSILVKMNSIVLVWTLALAASATYARSPLCAPGDRRCQKWVSSHHVVSRAAEFTISDLVESVKNFIAKSHVGVEAEDIAETAQRVMDQVDALLDGMVVENGAVSQLLHAALDKIDIDNSQMVTALKLWDALVDEAKQMEEAGEATGTVLAAIKKTASNIKNIVGKVLYLVHSGMELAERSERSTQSVTKRGWHVSGGAKTNGHGVSGHVSVGFDW